MNGCRSAHERVVRRAYRVGAGIGVLLFVAVLAGGSGTLLGWTRAGDFYDAQAASLLDGRLDIDPDVLGIEAFDHDGRSYMYQPPWPALLRVPVAAVTDRFEGRLGAVSMLLAMAVLLVATERVLVEARRAVRGSAASTALERLLHLLFGLVVAGGWVPTFLASRAWVYHEAAMWGLAWAVVATAGLLALRRGGGGAALAVVAAGCAGAVLSRATVGAGTCAAVGLVAILRFVERRDEPIGRRLLGPAATLPLLIVAAVPAIAYAALNVAKFGTPASIPFEAQRFTSLSPARQAMLEASGGTLFGLQFAPTTLLHYLRPSGIRLSTMFPFVDFPPSGGPVVGDVTFDLIDHTASIPAAMPAAVVAALLGVWLLARRRVDDPAIWVVVAAGGLVGSLTIIPFGYVAQRYQADVVPLLVPLAALGVHHLPRGRPARVAAGAAAVVLAAWTVVAHVGLATAYQRLRMPNPTSAQVAGLLGARLDIGAEPEVRVVSELPPSAERDDVALLDGCRAVYVWDGTPVGELRRDAWVAAERTRGGGRVVVEVDLSQMHPGVRYALVRSPGTEPVVAWVERRDGDVVGGFEVGGREVASRPAPASGSPGFVVVVDRALGEASLHLGDRLLASTAIDREPGVADLRVGEAPTSGAYAPSTPVVDESAADGALCERLAASTR